MQATSSIEPLKTYLKDWEDLDIAAYRLAICLGLMQSPSDDEFETFRAAKSVFWSNDKLGTELYEFIYTLITIGILEMEHENDQIRWNPSFKGSWEQ